MLILTVSFSPPQIRHPERSAARIYRIADGSWRGVEGPVPSVAGNLGDDCCQMFLRAFQPQIIGQIDMELGGVTDLALFFFGQQSRLLLLDLSRFRLSLKCVEGDSGPQCQQKQAQNGSKGRMLLTGKHEHEEDTQA